MDQASWIINVVVLGDLVLRLALSLRIIMRRRPVGVTFAWLIIVLILPLVGIFVYLTFGELRLGNRRAKWAERIHEPYREWLTSVEQRHPMIDWSPLGAACEPLSRLCESVFNTPVLAGNQLRLLPDWEAVFRALIADIDAAKHTCHLEFYIWHQGGLADEVVDAVIRAAHRGVICRILLDDVGSRPFLRSQQAKQMQDAGVHVKAALPAGFLRMWFYRVDLRLHRKIVVVDGEVAYTGSLNLVDPRHFKQEAGVGQWVDAMVRVEGPIVESLAITFLEDWELDTDEGVDQLRESGGVHELSEVGTTTVQVIPSGPVFESRAVQDVLLTTIYLARRELILTSPYFVPDEVLVSALTAAARRGVDVMLVIPAEVDSLLVRHASRAYQDDLLEAGVKIALFHGGLLHTKSVTVDGEFCLFGSLNLDARSLHLNFEITLAVYDRSFTEQVRRLQLAYVDDSTWINAEHWRLRPLRVRLVENVMRLLSPLL